MRELTTLEKSTPTYLFNVTDHLGSGVDIASLKICMILKAGEALYIIMPDRSALLDYTGYTVWEDPSYCRNIGIGIFSITLPLWKYTLDSDTVFNYQVFLYSDTQIKPVENKSIDDNIIDPGIIQYHNILIDEGTLTLSPSLFPDIASGKRGGTTVTIK